MSETGNVHEKASLIGAEGLLTEEHTRNTAFAGVVGGMVGLMLYSELSRAMLFDSEIVTMLLKAIAQAHWR